MVHKNIIYVFAALVLISLISTVLATTASIGNSRMILRTDPGQEIERYILVKNVNDQEVTIHLEPQGDLERYVTLEDNDFTLSSNDSKKAYFKLESPDAGTSSTSIVVKFTPSTGNSVALASTVIVIAGNSSDPISYPPLNRTQDMPQIRNSTRISTLPPTGQQQNPPKLQNTNQNNRTTTNNPSTNIQINQPSTSGQVTNNANESSFSLKPALTLGIVTAILILVLLAMTSFYMKKNRQNMSHGLITIKPKKSARRNA